MSAMLEAVCPPVQATDAVTPEEAALAWLRVGGVTDAQVEAVARPTSWTAEVFYRRAESFWVLACERRGRLARVVETPFAIEGLLLLAYTDEGWMVTGTQSVVPPELICGGADLYLPGGGRKFDRVLLSCHPERYGLRSPRAPVW